MGEAAASGWAAAAAIAPVAVAAGWAVRATATRTAAGSVAARATSETQAGPGAGTRAVQVDAGACFGAVASVERGKAAASVG